MKIKQLLLFFLSVFFFSAASGCAQDTTKTMSISELKNAIKNDTSLIILDVRNPEELKGPLGSLDNIINIPVQDLQSRIGELEKYKNKNIAVICRTGHRSAKAQKILSEHGFSSKSVSGGMTEYRKENE
ncbi:MAG: rhodanese-like domain-containing protein [Bacteroidota bacterium]|nr:rhodanese-like domain-containing protein [Bacteroidota bacterium]MDP4190009.1 rhodanese-like domain-containing protein [Bacteroidota bacterium]MDP4193441.1 rhodanese-like domain-containing protein [Bacteroidota bacterium]